MTEESTDLSSRQPDGVRWRKSKFSGTNNCVTVADRGDRIAVRHSLFPDGGVLLLTRTEMAAWLKAIKAGEFDDLVSPSA